MVGHYIHIQIITSLCISLVSFINRSIMAVFINGAFLCRWETRVEYYLRYKGKIVNSASWPKLNTSSLQEYVRDDLNLTSESGLHYVITPSLPTGSLDYRYHFSLFMKTKVAYADFTKFASSIKETWLTAHSRK